MSLIKADNLIFTYDVQSDSELIPELKAALDCVNISIEKGEIVAILGHNGSGKSTFAKHINAILTPTGGSMTVSGYDTADETNLIAIRRRAGMVFQNPDNQLVASLVEDDVAFAPENLGVDPKIIRKRVDEALQAVNMTQYRHHEVHKLSGGQKQRVAIAGVLAMEPEIIILDEPTAMLDPRGRKEVMETVLRLNREKNMTVVLITHYMDEAASCDRVVVMNEGKVLADGTAGEIFAQVELLQSVGLEVPEITKIAHSLREQGVDFPADVLTVEDFTKAFLRLTGGNENE